MTVETVLELKAEYGGICPYCNTVIVKGHVDHVAPISRAGTNDRNNLVWVCQNCNVQKGDKSLLHFLLYRKNLAVAL
jgi:5-methylcytosine-specific restriction endonuclease McrA